MRSLPTSITAGLFGIRRVKWAIQSWWRTGKILLPWRSGAA
jgi:hypothetical protein